MSHSRTLELLDKTQGPHTVLEDLLPFLQTVEFLETGAEKINNVKISLKIDKTEKFIKTSPMLVGDPTQPHNQQPKDKYLIYGFIEQNSVKGTEFRGYISATEQDLDENGGTVLVIYVTTQDIRTNQTLVSRRIGFRQFNDALSLRVLDYNLQQLPTLTNPAISIEKNDFPTDERLRQNFELGTPRKLHDTLVDMMKRLANPNVVGGTFKDFYIRIDPDTLGQGRTDNLLLTAEEFGEVDSGVTIAPTTFIPLENKKVVTDNTKYFNHVIAKAGPFGTLPQGYMRNISNFDHARRRPFWNGSSFTYLKDALVQKDNRYFKALVNHTSSAGTPPESSLGSLWTEDYVIDASYAEWNNIDDFKANLTGFVVPKAGYEGGFVDFNFVRRNNDRTDFTNEFETITLKDIERVQLDPPSADVRFDGLRVLINNLGGSGSFLGKKNQIAEWNVADNEWKFSKVAVDNDMVYDRNAGALLQYDLASDTWDYPTDFFGDKLGFPTHPVKSISLTENAFGVQNAALRFRFDWDTSENQVNAFSRGFWINWWLPNPRKPTVNGAIGHLYKNPVIDTNNMTLDSKGEAGWNNGMQSMDLGKMKALFLELRPNFRSADNNLVDFIPEIEVGIAFVDKFLHINLQDGVLRRNGAYGNLVFPVGENAPTNLYDNRIEELRKIYPGITLPFFDFELKEKEFSFTKFDWNQVLGWIVYWKGSYDDNGAYAGARNQFVDDARMILQQGFENLIHNLVGVTGIPKANTIIHHVDIDLGDWYFIKDMYATSSPVKLDEPITKIIRMEEESDFNNATIRTEAEVSRSTFFPQMWYLEAKGDVKLKRGQRFKVMSPEVPGGELELTLQECKHISDGNSYTIQAVGVRKFEPAL